MCEKHLTFRDDGLHARSPTEREVAYYGLNSDVAVFLPPAGDEDAEAERLAKNVKSYKGGATPNVDSRFRSFWAVESTFFVLLKSCRYVDLSLSVLSCRL